MRILLCALSGNTILAIVVTCILATLTIAFSVVYLLWKKNKITGRADAKMCACNTFFIAFGQEAKNKFLKSKKFELIIYWFVVVVGIVNLALNFSWECINNYYSLNLVRNIFFLLMLLLMICFNHKLAPIQPYYYDYNPALVAYSGITMLFALIDLGKSLSSGFLDSIMFGSFWFIGNILFYGTIFLTRFSKNEFKPRDLLVYLGAFIVIVVDIVYFFLYLNIPALLLAQSFFEMVYSIAIIILFVYFYDSFDLVKRIFYHR